MTQSETIHGKFKSYHSNSPRTGSAVEEDKKHIYCLCHSMNTDTLYGSLFTLPLRLTCSQLMSVPIPSKTFRRIIIICTASFQENRETATLPQIHDNIILSGNHHHHHRPLNTPPPADTHTKPPRWSRIVLPAWTCSIGDNDNSCGRWIWRHNNNAHAEHRQCAGAVPEIHRLGFHLASRPRTFIPRESSFERCSFGFHTRIL